MTAKKAGFRLGIFVFKDAEIVDFAAPHGVFSVARRYDPELDAFLIADANRPVQAQAGFTVLPNYSFADEPYMDITVRVNDKKERKRIPLDAKLAQALDRKILELARPGK